MNDQPARMIPASIAARLTIWIWAGYAIWQGLWIAAGGVGRWGSPSFDVLRQAPYPPTLFWGSILIGLGIALAAASLLRLFWVKAVCCMGIATWSICFALGAIAAANRNPNMSSTGGPTYIAIAASVLVLVFVEERRKPLAPRAEPTRYAKTTTPHAGQRRRRPHAGDGLS